MTAVQFFYRHAGFSYDPKTETKDDGRRRCAINLARAESKARDKEWRFFWSNDCDYNQSEQPDYPHWCCYLMDGESDEPLTCLGGIDLGPDGSPFDYTPGRLGEPIPHNRDPYCRIVESELAWEMLAELGEL